MGDQDRVANRGREMNYKFSKVDLNHTEIVNAFKRFGFSVADLSRVGGGVPDLMVSRGGHTFLVEVKSKKGKLRPNQINWHRRWKGEIKVIRSVEDVQALGS